VKLISGISFFRASAPSGARVVGSPSAVGSQEAGGQLLPQALPPLDSRYSSTQTHFKAFLEGKK